MILYAIDPTVPATVCRLVTDDVGELHVMLGEELEVPKSTRLICTTTQEHSALKVAGYNAGYDPEPTPSTMNGVPLDE